MGLDVKEMLMYVTPSVCGVCIIVGWCIKQWKAIPNKYIPTIICVLGVGLSVWAHYPTFDITTILIGLMSGALSVCLHQQFKLLIGDKGEYDKGETKCKG